LGKELIDRVQSVGLNSIIGSEKNELGDVGLEYRLGPSVKLGTMTVKRQTGRNPPGGLVLAQAQSGSLHVFGSQE